MDLRAGSEPHFPDRLVRGCKRCRDIIGRAVDGEVAEDGLALVEGGVVSEVWDEGGISVQDWVEEVEILVVGFWVEVEEVVEEGGVGVGPEALEVGFYVGFGLDGEVAERYSC